MEDQDVKDAPPPYSAEIQGFYNANPQYATNIAYSTAQQYANPPEMGQPNPALMTQGYQAGGPPVGQYGTPGIYVQPGLQQQGAIIYQRPPADVPNFDALICLSCFVMWCCGLLCGVVACMFASNGRERLEMGQIEDARRLARASLRCSVVGIVLGVIAGSCTIGLVVASGDFNYD